VTLHSLPLFVRLAGRPVILLGEGEAADAKRRLLERAGAIVSGEEADAALAIVAIEDEGEAVVAVARLKARGMLVNAVDRPALCDFTLPAIVDRAPVLIAIGTGGVSAGLAAALRQRLEALLPSYLGEVATALQRARKTLKARFPDPVERRRVIAAGLAPGGPIDPLGPDPDVDLWLQGSAELIDEQLGQVGRTLLYVGLTSPYADQLTLRQARALANADRVLHGRDVPRAILNRARADAEQRPCDIAPHSADEPGLTVYVEMR
jgi:uroporphyrin-III C-methyltransferase/precorrin-2 dehydrogenase/sirohydrochlorin ferrochelatase